MLKYIDGFYRYFDGTTALTVAFQARQKALKNFKARKAIEDAKMVDDDDLTGTEDEEILSDAVAAVTTKPKNPKVFDSSLWPLFLTNETAFTVSFQARQQELKEIQPQKGMEEAKMVDDDDLTGTGDDGITSDAVKAVAAKTVAFKNAKVFH